MPSEQDDNERITIEVVTRKTGQKERVSQYSGSDTHVNRCLFIHLYAEFPCELVALRML